MTPLPPVVRPPGDSLSGSDPACRVNNVVPTSAIFAAALERLNRTSTITLFQKLTQEIDEHCRTLGGAVAGVGVGIGMGAGPGRPSQEGAARAELVALIALLRETTEQHRSEIALIQKQLSELQGLSAKSQGAFEAQVSALFNRHIEQSLTPALTAASSRIEQNVATVFDRDLKQIETRLAKEVAVRERPARRGWLLTALLVLLIGGLCVLIGLLLGRRNFSQPCPAVNCCGGGTDGRTGIGPVSGTGVSAAGSAGAMVAPMVAPMGALSPSGGTTRESEIKSSEIKNRGAAPDGASASTSATPDVRNPGASTAPIPDIRNAGAAAAGTPGGRSPKIAGTTSSSGNPIVAGNTDAARGAGSQKEYPGLSFVAGGSPGAAAASVPGSMEAELQKFLKQPGAKAPRVFVMDRLQFASGSHEVNQSGKEQVRALAQILNSHPTTQIEIRGHTDGTEGEVYSGPDQHPGMSLSQIRADCVLKRLQFQRVPSARMRITGMGATRPVGDVRSEEGRQRSRRVEIVVTKK